MRCENQDRMIRILGEQKRLVAAFSKAGPSNKLEISIGIQDWVKEEILELCSVNENQNT